MALQIAKQNKVAEELSLNKLSSFMAASIVYIRCVMSCFLSTKTDRRP